MEIPPLPPGFDRVVEAGIVAALSWWSGQRGGRRQGQGEGRAEFINAVQEAAELAINELKDAVHRVTEQHRITDAQHRECERNLAEVRGQIDDIMTGRVPLYHLNHSKLDGGPSS